MKLLDYIQGKRKGSEAHEFEKEAMHDPFLSEALDGYCEWSGDHMARIQSLRGEIDRRSRDPFNWQVLSIAATLLLLISAGGYLLWQDPFNGRESLLSIEIHVSEPDASIDPAGVIYNSQPLPLGTTVLPLDPDDTEGIAYDIPEPGYHQLPAPIVGKREYTNYLFNNIQLPVDNSCPVEKGHLKVSFKVNPFGRPYDIIVTEGICQALDQETVRLLYEGPNWTPSPEEVELTLSF